MRSESLGFSLNFMSGKGLLTLTDRTIGPFHLKTLELEIPELSFPFDVTGGSEKFKTRRCKLRHLVFGMDADRLVDAMRQAPLLEAGFQDIRPIIRDGHVDFTGRFAVGDHSADFTFRAAMLLRSRSEVGVVFYDARVYGWLPVPAALLPVYLERALSPPWLHDSKTGIWRIRPVDLFLRHVLPRHGWKIPEDSDAGLTAAECARGQWLIVAGPETDPSQKQARERAPATRALWSAEGTGRHIAAETALVAGDIRTAYEHYRDVLDDDQGGAWVKDRLLQIGAADYELTLETRQLAEEVLAEEADNVQALLALGAIAMRERSYAEAAARYASLAERFRKSRERFDAIAAELAAAEASTPIDPGGALAAYERAAARARDSVAAHRALLKLRADGGDWAGAVQAGERLVKLETEADRRAGIHRQLGVMCRSQLGDLKRARLHFERALRIVPDDPLALEGLAETFAARGEPARAAGYLARLADQAEARGTPERIAQLNLRLGQIWERWLGDRESATGRYLRVLEADDQNRTARLRLAALAEAAGDYKEARAYYEDMLADEEQAGVDPDAIPDLVSAYTRLAYVTLASEGPTSEVVASLERAVELEPTDRVAREELSRVLRARGEIDRLLSLLDEWLGVADEKSEGARRMHMLAAQIHLQQPGGYADARAHLESVLDLSPDDPDALELVLPVLEDEGDVGALTQRLAAAADATAEPVKRADFLYRLSMARAKLGLGAGARLSPLEDALVANPYHHRAALEALRLLRDNDDKERLANILECLAVAAVDGGERVAVQRERAALLWKALGRPEEAEAALRETLIADPDQVDGWLDLAAIQEERDMPVAACETLMRVIAQHELPAADRAPIHRRLAAMAAARSDSEEQARQLKELIACGVVDVEITDQLAAVLEGLGRRHELAEHLESWAREDLGGQRGVLLARAAAIFTRLGDTTHAADLFAEVMNGGGGSAEVLAAAVELESLARELADVSRTAEAIEVQIERSAGEGVADARRAHFARLIDTYAAFGDGTAAVATCRRLLDVEPLSIKARTFLAGRAAQESDFSEMLDQLTPLVLEVGQGVWPDGLQLEVFEQAMGLALEVGTPALVEQIQQRIDACFADAEQAPQVQSYGDVLVHNGEWSALLELRKKQLASGPPRDVQRTLEVADLLYRRLGRSSEALGRYEEVLAVDPLNVAATDALSELYCEFVRFGDYCKLQGTVARQADDVERAITAALRGAEVAIRESQDPSVRDELLNCAAGREDTPPDHDALLQALRDADLLQTWVSLRERSLEAGPAVDDGRFAELIGVLVMQIGDRQRAVDWSRRMARAVPQADEGWRTWINLLDEETEGDDKATAVEAIAAVLREWSAARQGEGRTALLLELAELLGVSAPDGAVQALLDAAETSPSSKVVLSQLVEALLRAERHREAVDYLEKLAALYEAGEQQHAVLRRVVDIALSPSFDGGADTPAGQDRAADALAAMVDRSEEETRILGQLLVRCGRFAELAEHGVPATQLAPAELRLAGTGLAAAQQFDAAQQFFDAALVAVVDSADAETLWHEIEALWCGADEQFALARWRIAWSGRRSAASLQPAATVIRLRGALELLAAYDARGEETSVAETALYEAGGAILADLDHLNLADQRQAELVFRLARRLHDAEWSNQAATALSDLGPGVVLGEGLAVDVLKFRLEWQQREGRADDVVELARRLLSEGEAWATEPLESALYAAGRTDELIEHLCSSAQKSGDPATWLRIAELHTEKEEWQAARTALLSGRPTELHRLAEITPADADQDGEAAAEVGVAETKARAAAHAWATLWQRCGVELADVAVQVEAALLLGGLSGLAQTRGRWLRSAARLQWWQLEDRPAAHLYLIEAQRLDPLSLADVDEDIDGLQLERDLTSVARRLEEALVFMPESLHGGFLLRLVELWQDQGDPTETRAVLARAVESLPDDAPQWPTFAEIADAVEDPPLAIAAWQRAYGNDRAVEEAYIGALMLAGFYVEVAELLERRAGELAAQEPEAAATRLQRAAAMMRDRLEDKEKALDLFGAAVQVAPSEENMIAFYELSVDLHRGSAVAAIGPRLLDCLAADYPLRADILRRTVDALVGAGGMEDALPWWRELIARDLATAEDHRLYAEGVRQETPEEAARHYDIAGQKLVDADPETAGVQRFLAAELWVGEADTARAQVSLAAALDGGLDSVAAHIMAESILTGGRRFHSIARLIALDGDASLEPERRIDVRLDLAAEKLAASDLEAAHSLLHDVRERATPPRWVHLYEQLLQSKGDGAENALALAQLWLDASGHRPAPWPVEEHTPRMQQAVQAFRGAGDTTAELAALECLSEWTPEDLGVRDRITEVAAEIGDADQLDVQIRKQLGRLTDPYAREQLAARYCPLLARQFERHDLAMDLAGFVFSDRPSASVAAVICELLAATNSADTASWSRRFHEAALRQDIEPPLMPAGRIEILDHALRLAEAEPDAIDAVRALHNDILQLDPTHLGALGWLEDDAASRQAWQQQFELCAKAADAHSGPARRECLERAAALCRERLDDSEAEFGILARLHEEWPEEGVLAAQFADMALNQDHPVQAKNALLGGRIRATQAVPLAQKIAGALSEGGETAAAQETLDWATEAFPHSLLASDVRLARARDAADAPTLLQEIEVRLEHPATFDVQEIAELSLEAATLSRVVGNIEGAVQHYRRALQSGDMAATDLLMGYIFARELDSADEGADGSLVDVFVDGLLPRLGELEGPIGELVTAAAGEPVDVGAATVHPAERVAALLAVAEVQMKAEDTHGATTIHERVIELSDGQIPAVSAAALASGYQEQERWAELCALYERLGRDKDAKGRAELHYRAGFVARDRLQDGALARRMFEGVLVDEPEHLGAQRCLGLLLASQGELVAALPLLQRTLKGLIEDLSTTDLLLFIAALRHGEDTLEDTLAATGEVLRREPQRTILHAERASALERAEQREAAERSWLAYLEALGDGEGEEEQQEIVRILMRLADWAGEREDYHLALQRLRRALELGGDAQPMWQEVLRLSERADLPSEQAEAHTTLARLVEDRAVAVEHLRAAAVLFRDTLADEERASACLEQALEHEPENVGLLQELLVRYESGAAWDRFLVIGERVLALVAEEELDADFFARLARAYHEAADDPGRAKEFYNKAAVRDPTNVHLHEKRRELAQMSGDFETLAEAEEAVIDSLDDNDEKVERLRDLAEIYLRHLDDLGKAATALARARQLHPDNTELKRRLADTYALEERFYDRAAILYEEVVADDPLAGEVIRIRARLAGQAGDTDRAYGYYAALLALEPQDDEARTYVLACRNGRALIPQRALTDADRVQGLIHVQQQGAIEGLFAPLARFAELTRPGDLRRRGLSDTDIIAADTALPKTLTPVLARLGVAESVFYRWPSGGYVVQAELVGQPTFLLGGNVEEDKRLASFLTARAAELYRTGHTLCERMSEFELAGLLAALCIAVEPHSQPPGMNAETAAWAETVGTPMTDEIRAHLAPMVLSFLAGRASMDVGAWRRAAMISASRTALLLTCDIDEALTALVRMRGFEDLTDEQSVAVIRESPEAVELLRFALSEPYYRLRQSLGLALRKN